MTPEEARERLNITVDLIPEGNSNRPGTPLTPSKVTIHNTDNDDHGANARAHASYQKGADARAREVSWHFTVDDGSVYQSLPVRERGWHAGSGNAVSIAIEICENEGIDQSAANDRAALLTALLLREHGLLPTKDVVQHHHWTGKNCPHLLRIGDRWAQLLQAVTAYYDEIDAISGDECTLCAHASLPSPAGSGAMDALAASPFAPEHGIVNSPDGEVNVRSGPSLNHTILAVLQNGEAVDIYARSGSWCRIAPAQEQWVHGGLLRLGGGGGGGGGAGIPTINCAGEARTIRLSNQPDVTLPASGRFVGESHYVTNQDTFSQGRRYPSSQSERIQDHLARSLAIYRRFDPEATINQLYGGLPQFQQVWTPSEGGNIGQGSVGDLQLAALSSEMETWFMTMMWEGGHKPAPGTKFLLKANGRQVVAVAGFETGPGSSSFLGGVSWEIHAWLETTNDSQLEISALSDQSVPAGPVICA